MISVYEVSCAASGKPIGWWPGSAAAQEDEPLTQEDIDKLVDSLKNMGETLKSVCESVSTHLCDFNNSVAALRRSLEQEKIDKAISSTCRSKLEKL